MSEFRDSLNSLNSSNTTPTGNGRRARTFSSNHAVETKDITMRNNFPWSVNQTRGNKHEKLCEYLILAEFDIDTGSTVRHQYPNKVDGYKDDWFAENMLPEGLHNRDIDYTYIFLNRDGKQIDENYWIKPKEIIIEQNLNDKDVNNIIDVKYELKETKKFLYGINLVRTKHDKQVRRGAVVKALAIFSQYHFIEIYKKPLDITLQRYFDNPTVEVLEQLYNSLNNVDLSSIPRPNANERLLMKRGLVIKSLGNYNLTKAHQPQSWQYELNIDLKFNNNEKEIDKEIDNIKSLISHQVTVTLPLYYCPDEVGNINVSQLVKIFGESTMKIFHGIITNQRILFVGYNHAASDVSQMVLSTISLVAPPLNNIIRRTFPYANLTDLNFLQTPGYIAGVTNPMFSNNNTWWDLLCELDLPNGTGTVISADEQRLEKESFNNNHSSNNKDISKDKDNSANDIPSLYYEDETAYLALDEKFIIEIQSGIQDRLGDSWIRQRFYDYTCAILNQAQDNKFIHQSLSLNENIKKEMYANKNRSSKLRKSTDFKILPLNPWVWCENDNNNDPQEKLILNNVLKSHIRRIQCETSLHPVLELAVIYSELANSLTTEGSVQAMLSLWPDSIGGLHQISLGLLHSNPSVKMNTVKILKSVNTLYNNINNYYNIINFIYY
jgi:hypothetical protein